MRISEARRRPVVSTEGAQTIGHVDGFLIEPEAGRITGLRLGDVDGSATVLPWDRLTAFGVDAITVPSAEVLRAPAGDEARRSDPDLDPIGKPAIEETGDTLGTVADVEFDADTGAIRSVLTDVYDIPVDKLLGLGTFAMTFADLHR